MERAAKRGPCDRCDGTGRVGFERCFPCGGSGELAQCRRHDFAAFESLRRRNRARGLCACGAAREAGRSSCARCRARRAATARQRRAAVRSLPLSDLFAAVHEAPADSPVAREARRRARALPAEFRRYGVLGLSLHAGEVERERRRAEREARKAAERARPVWPTLTERQKAFVVALFENGGNRSAAALAAGYGARSAANRGRAASVAGCRIARRPSIVRAVAEYWADLAEREALVAALERLETMRRAEAILRELAAAAGPFSEAAKLRRQLRGEPVSRLPGMCRCGAPADAGRASCTPCRARSRLRGRVVRLVHRDRINARGGLRRLAIRLRRRALG